MARNTLARLLTAALSCALTQFALAQPSYELLQRGFISPPDSAKPRVWWHWMNGNITKEGIKLDLEWMHRTGLGGFQVFDAALKTPQVVDKRLVYMTPEWKEAFKYATVLADELNLEEAVAGSPGWSETGGPWVPASQGMKKYVWSATPVSGGKPFYGKLASPPGITGPFQNIPLADRPPLGAQPTPQYYADSVVVAYRRAADDIPIKSLHPKMTASGGAPDFAMLTDGDLANATKIPIPPRVGQSAWFQYEFPKGQTIRAITFVTVNPDAIQAAIDGVGAPDTGVEASDDGQHFHEVARLVRAAGDTGDDSDDSPEYTLSFPPVTAKYFRVTFIRTPPPPRPYWTEGADLTLRAKAHSPPTDYEICELMLHAGARVNRWEEKAAFIALPDLYSLATPHVDSDHAVAKSDVIDLSSKLQANGRLDWVPPPGEWIVVRFGYSLLGTTNAPATAEATGLEVDKLDRRFVKQYFERYLDSYREAVGSALMGTKGIRYVINDSWEAGSQNWTDNLIEQFKAHRGYDPIPWMPVLVGQVVESAEASDKFLWDFRKTLADLVADEHYGQLEATLHEHHMGHYAESHEEGRAFVGDGMEVKKFTELPMGAMWTQTPGVNKVKYGYNADDRESASVAHIYGQNLAAAESLTASAAPWAWSPATLKPTADQELLNGINRFVIHESAHQPLIGKAPGMTLGPYGQWFNRNETWAEQAGAWITYLARASFLLQQGRFGADIVHFYGEDSNLTALFYKKAPRIPGGYGFDYINADGLIHELSVADGHIVSPSGMNYRVLSLDPYSQHMSLPVLRAIHKLVEHGAVLAGPKPTDDPSLADDTAEFRTLNDQLFGDGTGTHRVGTGIVYADEDLSSVLKALDITPDFDYTGSGSDTNLLFVHRKLGAGDIYFVDNRSDRAASVDATFRVTGKAPELWRAEDGTMEPATYKMDNNRTTVPLKLEPWGTVFVVFLKATMESARALPATSEKILARVDGDWKLAFQPDRGAPAAITLNKLESWTRHSDPGVRYFSGIGTYTKTILANPSWFKKGTHLWIDLGDVKNLAEVTINGKSLGVVWHAPFRVDVTTALEPGANQISIKVINAWVNRLIGDQQPGVTTPITFADVAPYKANSPLLDSGLLGPVTIVGVITAGGP